MNQEIYDKLSSVPYPHETIPQGFGDWLTAALYSHSEHTLNCSFKDYKKLVEENPKRFSLQLMGYAINAITFTKPLDITDSCENYLAIRERVNGMVANWDRIAQPLRADIIKTYQTKAALQILPTDKIMRA